MTLYEYLNSPMGKGISLGLSEIKNHLDKEYEELRYSMSMIVYWMKERYIVYVVQLPSRHAKGLKYQIVFQFDTHSIPEGVHDVKHLNFQCFSNSPSFVYTYAEVFKEKEMLLSWSKDKYDREILHNSPEVRNSQKLISYERSLYLAGKFITLSGKSRIEFAKLGGTTIKNDYFFTNNIPEQSIIENKYKELTRKKEPTVSEKEINKIPNKNKSDRRHSLFTPFTKKTSSTNNIQKTLFGKKIHKI